MAISYVGGKVAGSAGQGGGSIGITTGLTGGSGGAPIEGDLVVVTVSVGTQARQPTIAISTPSGYTALTAQRTTTTTYDTNVQTCYKVMGSTPDTAVTIPPSGNTADGIAYAIQVFRGVDPTTPMDTAATYATGTGSSSPNPAAITPVTAGAWILCCVGTAAQTGPTSFSSAPFTNIISARGADTNDGSVGSGYYTGWTSGSYDPATWGGGLTNAANSWGATTLALRPAPQPQSLTPTRFDDSQTFYSPTVSIGAVTLLPSRFDDAQTFYSPDVSQPGGAVDLQPGLYSSSQSFYSAAVATSITLTAARYDGGQVFYTPSVAAGAVSLGSPLYGNTQAFYAASIATGAVSLLPARLDNAQNFYAATISLGGPTQDLQPTRVDGSQVFYSASIGAGVVTLLPVRFDSAQTFYGPTVLRGAVSLQAQLATNANQFYAPSVSVELVALAQASRLENGQLFFSPFVGDGVPPDDGRKVSGGMLINMGTMMNR